MSNYALELVFAWVDEEIFEECVAGDIIRPGHHDQQELQAKVLKIIRLVSNSVLTRDYSIVGIG